MSGRRVCGFGGLPGACRGASASRAGPGGGVAVGAVGARRGVWGASGGMLGDIDLEVRSGEVVGLAGLQGSGRTELARAIFGVEPFEAGEVEVDGESVRIRSPREAIRHRIGFVTEDRKAEGIIPIRSVRENGWLGLRALGGRLRRALGLGTGANGGGVRR